MSSVVEHSLWPLSALSLCRSHRLLLGVAAQSLVLVFGLPNVRLLNIVPYCFSDRSMWPICFRNFDPTYISATCGSWHLPLLLRSKWGTVLHVLFVGTWVPGLFSFNIWRLPGWWIRDGYAALIYCHLYLDAVFCLHLWPLKGSLVLLGFYNFHVLCILFDLLT